MSDTKMIIPNVRLILGQPCRAIELSSEQEEPFIEPHRHQYWEIVWCKEDTGSQSIDFIEYENRANRLFTIAPGQVHLSEYMGQNVRLLVFAPGFVETNKRSTQLVESVFSTHAVRPPYIDCSDEGLYYLDSIFTMLKEECERDIDDCDWGLVESLINCFLRYMLRYAKTSKLKGGQRDARVGQLIELIDKHYHEEKKCEFYASELALTSKRLNEIVKAERGKTVTQLIHDRIILEANRDLIFSTKTVKTIAIELGFEDPAYFSRFYRKQMGESPAEFRLRCVDSATL
ncbi:helix-turn-helix domain-containing protein [Vibrio alfacsensis]|uniref:Helix-turn-helix domain-containing protein n=1 Tax=Vibrio alfacsensis TaxID=1074311 RepID=A0ABN5PK25_9VIBR|nr:helix-turn-helix domain-containing protein [Vibrio alfacsensis]AXY03544.1 helix-turn-helix domain-containing protein [Vibrio alfacsensis]